MTLQAELLDEIAKIPCINSHSHIFPETVRTSRPFDVFCFFQEAYYRSDLLAAGMPQSVYDRIIQTELDLTERWRLFEPYWRRMQWTAYGRSVREALADLCGVSVLGAETVVSASSRLSDSCKPGFYKEILRDRCNIRISLMNMGWSASKRSKPWSRKDLIEVDRTYFVPLPRLNRFSSLSTETHLLEIERLYDVRIGSLKDLVALIEQLCREWKEAGAAGVKMSHANHRALDFKTVAFQDAEKIFQRLLGGDDLDLESEPGQVLEDFLVFECCRAACESDLAVQFHTGMRAGNWRRLDAANPVTLTNLLKAFPEARFDLSHSGFPHLREAAILAKTYPNVFLNMSWIHMISPTACRTALKEWVEMVPANKMVGFGDDLQHVELVYGHLKIARENVASVLAGLISEGQFDEESGLELARLIFHDNPEALYRLHLK